MTQFLLSAALAAAFGLFGPSTSLTVDAPGPTDAAAQTQYCAGRPGPTIKPANGAKSAAFAAKPGHRPWNISRLPFQPITPGEERWLQEERPALHPITASAP